jgi:hypothetical protein
MITRMAEPLPLNPRAVGRNRMDYRLLNIGGAGEGAAIQRCCRHHCAMDLPPLSVDL